MFNLRSRTASPPQTFPTLRLSSPKGPMPGQFDASGYLFGVITTYERLMENDKAMLKSWQWWLTDGKESSNGAHLIVVLDRATEEQLQQTESALQDLTIESMVYNAEEVLSTATRYSHLAAELYAYGSALSTVGISKKWFILLDEAIFFPSLAHLDENLVLYDVRESIYIGVPSEPENDASTDDGRPAASQAGILIFSRNGLAHYLALSCNYSTTPTNSLFSTPSWASDIHECMTTEGQMPNPIIPGLHSPTIDTTSGLSGHFEYETRPVAIRSHLRGLNLASAYLVADECGEACFMQRFLFRDGWAMVNGVSISREEDATGARSSENMISTKEEKGVKSQLQLNDDTADSFRSNRDGLRSTWKLFDSSVDDQNIVWQAYVKEAIAYNKKVPAEAEELDSIIVLIWNDGKRR